MMRRDRSNGGRGWSWLVDGTIALALLGVFLSAWLER